MPIRILQLGCEIVNLVIEINEHSQIYGGEDIFALTNRLLASCSTISTAFAQQADDFKNIVEALYFLIYEGSGTAKRLETDRNADLLDPLWHLKHLRLLYRHDIEHGSPGEIKKKYKKIGEAFKALNIQSPPQTTHQWAEAQFHLYTALAGMLQGIKSSLSGSSPSA